MSDGQVTANSLAPGARRARLLSLPAAVRPYVGLVIAVLACSLSSTLIRLADAPPLVIGAYRLTLASLILTPVALWSVVARTTAGRELRQLRRRDLGLALVSGVFLGIHFGAWITSLEYTTVASSAVLVATNPLFVGFASHFIFRQRQSRAIWVGILVSILGAAIIGFGDFDVSGRALIGDLLALLGALSVSCYFLIGRELRSRLSLLTYVFPTYWTAAVVLALAAALSGHRFTGYSAQTYGLFLLLALLPQIIGHSLLNWTLRHLSPTMVTVSILGEPILSTALAFLVLAEAPGPLKLVGGALVLVGIYLTMQAERKRSRAGE